MGPLRLVLAFMGAAGLACLGPRATLEVLDRSADSGCSGILDYCISVTCTIRNSGDAVGQGIVTFHIQRSNGTWLSATEPVTLAPGDMTWVRHDFEEITMSDKDMSYTCSVEKTR